MAMTYLTQASSGAQRCAGVYGDATTLFDWAVSGRHGWTTAHTGTNERIYQSASGHLMYVNHKSADSGAAQRFIVRGCESATAVGSRTDDYPTVAQVANTSCNWLASSSADTTARNYIFLVGPDFVFFASKFDGTSWEWGFFGQVPAQYSGDSYNVICTTRNIASHNIPYLLSSNYGAISNVSNSQAGRIFWKRDITGAIKSERGNLCAFGQYPGGSLTGAPAALGGYLNGIARQKMGLSSFGSGTTTVGVTALMNRGWLPNIWQPLHNSIGGLTDADTFTDSAYNAGASFSPITYSTFALFVETTDTWAAP